MDLMGIETGYVTRYNHIYQVTKAQKQATDSMVKSGDEVQFSKNVMKCTQTATDIYYEKSDYMTCSKIIRKENVVLQKTDMEDIDYHSFLKEKINEIFAKIQNGDTEPSYQIGSQSFTVKEWEEFLVKFDSIEDAFKELQQEEFAKREEEAVQEVIKKKDDVSDAKIDMLVSETVSARFPLQKLDEDGNKQYEQYLIAIDENGIRCSKPGQDTYEWQIIFSDEKQYEKAREFLDFAGEHMDNMLFAAHENFWEDYLNDNMDVEAFQEFLMGTNNGLPDYSITIGDSVYVDKEKGQWAKYMNPLNAKFYTAEEMRQMQEELIAKNTVNKMKITDSYAEIYKKTHPGYHGERIFCEYPGGPLYTADEIMDVMLQNAKDPKYQTEARKNQR